MWMRRIGMVVVGLITIVAAGAATVYAMSNSKLTTKYVVPPEPALAVATDAATLARGEHVATSIAKCTACHGANLSGGVVVDFAPVGHVYATNLTKGNGGVLAFYDDAALERAIRHGIGHDGRNLIIMPSKEFHNLSDEDVTAVIAYIRAQPAVDKTIRASNVGPMIRAQWVAGKVFPINSAEIHHDEKHVAISPTGITEQHGLYIVKNGCMGCHGDGLSGGAIPGAPPDWKPAANITPTGIGGYSLGDFTRVLQSGRRPDGTMLDTLMPIKATKLMTAEEVESVYRFLKTVPPKPYGNR